MENPSVVIIMSVYNGRKYVIEQIDSILSQKSVSVKLWIRDDGSTDDTYRIVSEKYHDDGRVYIESGENLGACGSFIHALFSCGFSGDYYGFSDADDVWVLDKLKHSIEILKGNVEASLPVAVSTRLEVVDESLGFIGYTAPPAKGLTFDNAIVETVASGASILMNEFAFNLIRKKKPSSAVMHDAWVYLVVTAFGRFIYSDYPTIKYRQHGSNVYGASRSLGKKISSRLSRLCTVSPYRCQAVEFLQCYGDALGERNLKAISRYCEYSKSLLGRLLFSLRPSVFYQKKGANIYLRLLCLLGRA